ncbi:MAG: FxsA family protein [Nitrospinaceae bacterium]
MTLPVGVFFAVGTAVELYLLKELSLLISIVNTLSLIMLTFLLGIVVGRSWGNDYFVKMQWHLKSRTLPEDEVLNGAVMALASMFLITPGIITDTLGILILFSLTRGIFKELAADFVRKKISRGEVYYFFKD